MFQFFMKLLKRREKFTFSLIISIAGIYAHLYAGLGTSYAGLHLGSPKPIFEISDRHDE